MRTILCVALLMLPSFVLAAQFDDVLLTSNPENPRPGDRVTITATVLGNTQSGSLFTWLVNDKKVAEGNGTNSVTVDAPKLGDAVRVRVLVDGAERSAGLVIQPGNLTLEWEALTTAPPFYIGRSKVGGQGMLRVLAIPDLVGTDGKRVAPQTVNYAWRVNGSLVSSISGYGAQSAVIKPPFYNDPFEIRVLATSRSGQRAERAVQIQVADPDVVLYERSPLGGIIDTNAVFGTYPFSHAEVTFAAYPLNASKPADLEYQWTLNGEPVALNTGDPRIAVFRKTGSGTGEYTVGLNITSQKAFLDIVQHSFLLHF